MLSEDAALYHSECCVLALIVVLALLLLLANRCMRGRPGLRLRTVVLVAFSLRAGLAIALHLVPAEAARLRGPDDAFFLYEVQTLSHTSMAHISWLHHIAGDLTTALLALQWKVLAGPGDLSLRITQVGFTVGGILLLAVAVYDIIGARAAALAAWIAALEPSGLFFASMVQKESLTILGEGLLALACARAWTRLDRRAILMMLAAVALISGSRPYAGIFAAVGGAVLIATAFVRRQGNRRRRAVALTLAATLCVAGAMVTPAARTMLNKLARFQQEGAQNSRLALEPVDFSTVHGIVAGLPLRVRDYLVKPYPWQQQDTSQRIAAVPTLIAWLLLLAGLVALAIRPKVWLTRAPPLAVPAVFVTIGYALTTANAGTGFRHRTHALFFLAGIVAILWADDLPSGEEITQLLLRRPSRGSHPAPA